MRRAAGKAREFRFVDFPVPSYEDYDELAVAVEERGLDGLGLFEFQKFRQLLDGVSVRRGDLFDRLVIGFLREVEYRAVAGLVRGGIAAFRVGAGKDERFAGLGQDHQFVRDLAADGAGVSDDDSGVEAGALKDLLVGLADDGVISFKVFLAGVEGIAVLHDEFAAAHDAETGPHLVAELQLDVIDRERQLLVGPDLPSGEIGHGLLVRRAEDVVVIVAVPDDHHFFSIGETAAGFFPEFAGGKDRHQNFLHVDFRQLFPDDLFKLQKHVLSGRQIFVQTGTNFPDESGSGHQDVADDLRVLGAVLHGGQQSLRPAHKTP